MVIYFYVCDGETLLWLSVILLHFLVFNSYIANNYQDMSQHIPHEVLLGKENVQLSDVIGQGIIVHLHV